MANNTPDQDNKDAKPRPDPETLHTTDPQDNMEGPVSSLIKNTGDGFDAEEDSKPDADAEHDRKM